MKQTNNVCKMYITACKLAQDGLFSPAVIFIVNIIKTNKVNQIQFARYINYASLKSFQGGTNVCCRYLEQFYNSAGEDRKYFDDFLAPLRAPHDTMLNGGIMYTCSWPFETDRGLLSLAQTHIYKRSPYIMSRQH